VVAPRGDKKDLLSLVRVCKALGATAEPFLYHYLHAARSFDLYFFIQSL
jgi:hypothetical protein